LGVAIRHLLRPNAFGGSANRASTVAVALKIADIRGHTTDEYASCPVLVKIVKFPGRLSHMNFSLGRDETRLSRRTK
jgi:hypothetical protein